MLLGINYLVESPFYLLPININVCCACWALNLLKFICLWFCYWRRKWFRTVCAWETGSERSQILMSLPFQTVRLSGKQSKPTGDWKHSRRGGQGSMGQRTKLPCAPCLLHRLKVLFLLLSLHVTVLGAKWKQNVYTVISSFIQICICAVTMS